MKPFLGIDITADKKNDIPHGVEFLVAKPSQALAQAWEQSTEKAETTIEVSKLPKPLRIMQPICGIVALIFAGGIMKADVSLAQGYENAPWIFWTAGICGVIWLILFLWSKQKVNSILGTEENSQVFNHMACVADSIYAELGVPADAKKVDVLSFFYKMKNGEMKLVEKGVAIQYFNPVFHAFSDSENLYLANLEGKYAFPLSEITEIKTVKKHIRIGGWNKEEKYNKGIYKQYKLTLDNYGCIHCRQYHILKIKHQGESYGIYIPCYELPVFEELT